METNRNQRGGALILELILVAAVLVVAGVAVYASANKKALVVASPSATPRPTVVPSPSVSATPDAAAYLTIKELGIKLPLTSDIKDLVYSYTPATAAAPAKLHFSTTTVSAIPNGTGTCSVDQDPLGTYSVYATAQPNVGAADSQVGTLATSVGGHFIYYHHVQYACGTTAANQNQVTALINPLLTAVQSAKVTP